MSSTYPWTEITRRFPETSLTHKGLNEKFAQFVISQKLMWKLSSLSFLGQTHGTRKSSEPHTVHKPLMDIGERVPITLANISPGETFFYFRAANNRSKYSQAFLGLQNDMFWFQAHWRGKSFTLAHQKNRLSRKSCSRRKSAFVLKLAMKLKRSASAFAVRRLEARLENAGASSWKHESFDSALS